ncbi:hypothetical protein TCAL_14733 [Tigriopus californicus]|uniref:Uncharacterized protein n=1 Tax=Tigriopus californicus TaxID=6832 RepID=A0A553PEW4_TIGCA|nr:hypothetical protein TCAL_14733 [Tigriopus californicus]
MDRNKGSRWKAKLDQEEFKTLAQGNPLKSMCAIAKELGVLDMSVNRTIKKVNGKSLVRVERPLLTPGMKEIHLLCCKALLNDLEKARANRSIIFIHEKTWPLTQCPNAKMIGI